MTFRDTRERVLLSVLRVVDTQWCQRLQGLLFLRERWWHAARKESVIRVTRARDGGLRSCLHGFRVEDVSLD